MKMWILNMDFGTRLTECLKVKKREYSGLLLGMALSLFPMAECDAENHVSGFRTIQLSDTFYAEAATAADLDNDGDQDIIYGPLWFEGPGFEVKHQIYKPLPFRVGKYSDHFLVYAEDLDADGWKDILVLGFPGRKGSTYWMKNPGADLKTSLWKRFSVFDGVGNESPVWADVTGDGKKEILCSIGGRFGFVAPEDGSSLDNPWKFSPITPPKSTGGHYSHGLGFGDVNGDGRNDLLEKSGWWEQPASGKGEWKKHGYAFAGKGGSQMFAYDVDGDGDNDIITALDGHGYGFAWFEHVAKDGGITFERHLIMGSTPGESPYGVAFSQLHAMALEDVDGDGIKDIVTGKRYFAHGGKDPGGNDAPVIYWFRIVREKGAVDFVPYQIHNKSGVGTDVMARDLNGDKRVDVVVGNKKGCFVHLQTDKLIAAPVRKERSPTTRFEGESLQGVKGSGNLRAQDLRSFKDQIWSGQSHLWWMGTKPGAEAEFPISVARDGTYFIGGNFTTAIDYGIIAFSVDGQEGSKEIDFFSSKVTNTGPVTLAGPLSLKKGKHIVRAKIIGKNPAAKPGFMMGLDYLEIREDEKFEPIQSKSQ